MMAATDSRYDLARFGSEAFRASPRQADLMIVFGPRLQENGPGVCVRSMTRCPDPKWGDRDGGLRQSNGGVFNNYAVVQGR